MPPVEVSDIAAATVVMASGGYPGSYAKGVPISIPKNLNETAVVFHAGTAHLDGQLVTAGGRVLGVSEIGATVEHARAKAYEAVAQIEFAGAIFRQDIGA